MSKDFYTISVFSVYYFEFCSKNNCSKMSMATRTRSKNLMATSENNSDDDDDTQLLDAKLSSNIIFRLVKMLLFHQIHYCRSAY
jgi:hypothetical protein